MKSLDKALKYFNDNSIRSSLDGIYNEVPKGSCSGSALCCSESVNCFYSEFLNVVSDLSNKNILEEYSKNATAYYLTELIENRKCPLLSNNLCTVYDARPLVCRVFGHLNRDEYEENYESINDQNKEVAKSLKEEYSIIIPDEVLSKKIPFCQHFSSDTKFSPENRDDLVDRLFTLESQFLVEGFLDFDDINLSLAQWFAYLYLGREKASELRIKIAQEFSVNGKSETLNRFLL